MIFGGILDYLNYINRELSLAQNVDSLFFSKNAVLRIEYDRLFASVFKSPDMVKRIVELSNGTIWVERKLNEGTMLTVKLPIEKDSSNVIIV